MGRVTQISTDTLRTWLESGKDISLLAIRPIQERTEWFIPGSIYFNAYDKLKAHRPDALQGLHLEKTVPIVTICARGKTSLIAAEQLNEQGFEAYSLLEGMKGWSLSWNTARLSFPGFEVIQFRRTGKGCLSYLVVSNREALIVDASLPIETYEEFLVKEKLTLNYVIETHIHADHVKKNVAMLQLKEEEFVNTILQRIPPTPANYLTILEKNIKGDFSDINPVDLEAGANRCTVS